MFDASTLGRMLEFMYTGLYNINPAEIDLASVGTACNDHIERLGQPHTPCKSSSGETNAGSTPVTSSMSTSSTLVAHAHVYAIAEYYDVAGLKTIAIEKFKAAAENFQIEHFIEVVKVIYSTIPSIDYNFRVELFTLIIDDFNTLLNNSNFITSLINKSNI